jgi:HAE1 family hydrophobic/amphiphilic exporter-1
VRAHPEVRYTYTSVGTSSGSGEVDAATIYARLAPKGERSVSQEELGRRVRAEAAQVAGATVTTYASGFGGAEKQVQVQVRGSSGAPLDSAAALLLARLRQVPGAVDVGLSTKGTKSELVVSPDRALAGSLGLTATQITQSLRAAFAGVKAGSWVDPTGQTRDVTVRLTPEARANPADIADLPLALGAASSTGAATTSVTGGATASGAPTTVPLGQVASITQTTGPAQINHLDRDRVVTVGANVAAGHTLGEVAQATQRELRDVSLPPGTRLTQGGQVDRQGELFFSIFAALGLAVLLMYLILVMQFGSFLDPLPILASLPLSLIGVVAALVITRDTLNMMSLIGIILLMGIVAKNAILLIDFAKWQHEAGLPLREALVSAGRTRFRPIIMTTVALIAGMVPVALGLGEGGDFRAPLGRAVIGGTITSTLLTLLVVPTVYEILATWRERLSDRLRHRRSIRTSPRVAVLAPESGD